MAGWPDHPAIVAWQIQGALLCLLLGTLWILTGRARLGALGDGAEGGREGPRRRTGTESPAHDVHPPVAVVVPLKGSPSAGLPGLDSILGLEYAGEVENLFVVDSEADPAVSFVESALRARGWRLEHGGAGRSAWRPAGVNGGAPDDGDGGLIGAARALPPAPTGPLRSPASTALPAPPVRLTAGRRARILVSPPASSCSQKIQGLETAMRAAEPGASYALCLDDDVRPPPRLLARLVAGLEADPTLLCATGYPLEIPIRPDASITSYSWMAHHLTLLVGMSLKERGPFVWGGCMLLRLGGRDMDAGAAGAPSRGDAGGVSRGARTAGPPGTASGPPAHPAHPPLARLLRSWKSGGYSDDLLAAAYCKAAGLPVHSPAHALLPATAPPDPGLSRFWNYLCRQMVVLDTYPDGVVKRDHRMMAAIHAYLSWAVVTPALTVAAGLIARALSGETTASTAFEPGDAPLAIAAIPRASLSLVGAASRAFYLLSALYAVLALRHMTFQLARVLSHQDSSLPRPRELTSRFSWPRAAAGFFLMHLLVPFALLRAFAHDTVVWSGVRYTKRGGRVVAAQRLDRACAADLGRAAGACVGRPTVRKAL